MLSIKSQKATKKHFRKQQAKNGTYLHLKQRSKKAKHEVTIESIHPRTQRKKYSGEEIQMEESIHLWFGLQKSCLHLAIDNCTGMPVRAYFDTQETLNDYYHVFKQILKNYGIPFSFKTDNRTVFNYIKETFKKDHIDVLTQFGYACRQLGVSISTTSLLHSKGQVKEPMEPFRDVW